MIVDSNIIIYSLKSENSYIRKFISEKNISVSIITYLEVLGYHRLTDRDKEYFSVLFGFLDILPLSEIVVEKAIELRQLRKMTLGDSIIASSAICNNRILVTHNCKDFEWIPNIEILDIIKL